MWTCVLFYATFDVRWLFKFMYVTIFSHVGWFHDPRICQLYFVGPSKKLGIFIYYSYIQTKLGNLGEVVLLAPSTRIIVHPNIIRRNIVHPNIIPFKYY